MSGRKVREKARLSAETQWRLESIYSRIRQYARLFTSRILSSDSRRIGAGSVPGDGHLMILYDRHDGLFNPKELL